MNTQYAYSIKTSRVQEEDFPYNGQAINNSTDAIAFARALQDADIEKMITLYLDGQNKVICIQATSGTVNQAYAYPREIIRHALLTGATAIVLIHNHPSGNIKPSQGDLTVTKQIQEVAKFLDIPIHDHIIVGENGQAFSFNEHNMM